MNERRKRLVETLKKFNKKEKDEVLFFGNEIENQKLIPTGIELIDNFLGGGVKRGTHTIFWGDFSTGKTSLALQTIGNAQKQGKICVYINLEKPVDNERFVAMGVNLEELIRADCTKNAEQALSVIKTLCQEKVVDLIVIDSIQALSPKAENENKGKQRELDEKTIGELARTMSEFCRRVNADIYRAKASVIWIGQIRVNIGSFFSGAVLTGGNAIKFYAYQIIFMRKGQKTDAPVEKFKEYFIDPDGKIRYCTQKKIIGFDGVFKMNKTNSSTSVKENEDQHFPFISTQGFVNEVIELEETPIRIDAEATEEQKKKIKDYLIQKEFHGLMSPEKIFNTQQKINEAENYSASENKISEEVLTPKKKRGRPKKEKK